jgi:Carboxypeptidase regulatory-like domain
MYKVELRLCWSLVAIVLSSMAASAPLLAQDQNASIVGVLMDPNGNVIPGATVSITSPALQVSKLTTRTDAQGAYKLLDLPAPGVYRITFEASGFQTSIQEGVNLGVGFTAKIDGVLNVGSVTARVEVTTTGPVIDTVSTASTSTLQQQEIQQAPKGLGLTELLPMAAGASYQGKPDVGDSNLATTTTTVTYGAVLNPTLDVEGVNLDTGKSADSHVYLDSMALAEVEFKTAGNNAEIGNPGVAQVAVMKSGGNTFHGDLQGDLEPPAFQGNNITSTLAAPPNNLKVTNPLEGPGYYDYAGDLGGRIITNKLWFYGGYNAQYVNQGQVNFKAGPDASGCWTCADSPSATIVTALHQYNYKFNYQLKPSIKLIFSEMNGTKFLEDNQPSPSVPLPAGQYEHQPAGTWHGEAQYVRSSRFLLDGSFGYGGYTAKYVDQPASSIGRYGFTSGSDFAGSPSEEELSTGLMTGPYPTFPQSKPNNRYEMRIVATYLPSKPHFGGTHQFAFGTLEDWERASTRITTDKAAGDYLLEFQNGVPNKIVIYNSPFPSSNNGLNGQALFVTDTWGFRRVSINYGLRWERYDAFYPTQSKPAGQFSDVFPAATFAGENILTWNDVVPRAGASWDLAGNGKTVLKGSFGIFGDTMGDVFAQTFNPNAQVSNTYNWTGPCAATAPLAPIEYACDVTPAFLATLPSLTPTASTGGTSQIRNPGLKEDKTYEYTARVERQLMSNIALNVTYVNHSTYNLYNSSTNPGVVLPTTDVVGNGVTVGHPYSSWTIPVVFTDSFNGVSTPVTVYTYAKGSGATSNEVLNTPSSRPDIYNTIAIAVTKRYAKRWNGTASYWLTKNHRWIQGLSGIAGSPNDDAFPIDNTWNWEARGIGAYSMPKGFTISSFFRAQSGNPGQRLDSFNSGALSQGATTVRMGPFGQYRGPVISILNAKAAKVFTLRDRYHLEMNFQVYNILNNSAAVTTNYLNSPSTFNVVTSIVSPRVARVGVLFSF